MAKRKSSVIAEEMQLLRAELDELDETNAADIARSEVIPDEFEALQKELDEAQAHEKRIEAVRSAAVSPSNRETGTRRGPEIMRTVDPYENMGEVVRGRYDDGDVISRARKAVEVAPRHLGTAGRDHLETLLTDEYGGRQTPLIARHILMTGSEQYHRDFIEFFRSNGRYDSELLRTAMSLTDSAGGYLVPFTLDPTIILTNAGIISSVRQLATVKQTATDTASYVTSAGVTAEWLGEGLEAADASPGVGLITVTPKKAAAWVQASYELIQDSNIASELGRLFADAKDRLEGAAFATGNTGATKPYGAVTVTAAVTSSIVAAATTNAFVVADLYSLVNAVPARHQQGAQFLGHKSIYNKIRQFDTSGGAGLWTTLGGGRPGQLMGYDAFEESTMQSAVTTGGLVLLHGNFKEFYIVDRIGMSVQYNPMVMGITTQRPVGSAGWFAMWRTGTDSANPDSLRVLQLNQVASNVPKA